MIRRNLGSKLIQMVFSTPEEKAATRKLVKTIDALPSSATVIR